MNQIPHLFLHYYCWNNWIHGCLSNLVLIHWNVSQEFEHTSSYHDCGYQLDVYVLNRLRKLGLCHPPHLVQIWGHVLDDCSQDADFPTFLRKQGPTRFDDIWHEFGHRKRHLLAFETLLAWPLTTDQSPRSYASPASFAAVNDPSTSSSSAPHS
ncbi:hypothetical protein F3Y22_tig00014064pilonHSYRG00020 [Hibiscus syriacus]|uniref:Uncharacterized protein n=1 Tax=Hibiscus syriacus TaxID=106335 RepID=A0A6A3C5M6_HIBSY|nr:hypothetical protein F3Y22_tig00014064pilonHSYRG00020 [Hibiscus syriacus]